MSNGVISDKRIETAISPHSGINTWAHTRRGGDSRENAKKGQSVGDKPKNAPFSVRSLSLDTGETLPVLVHSATWIPVRVVTRWAVCSRRYECAENTLSNDLRAVGLLYEVARAQLNVDLDSMLESCTLPSGMELDKVAQGIRNGRESDLSDCRALSTTVTCLGSIRIFLRWAMAPANQGLPIQKTASQIAEDEAKIDAVFRSYMSPTTTSQRIQPLTLEMETRIKALFGPVRDLDSQIILPISFNPNNPFREENRLRNWLMTIIPRQCGHRRGELLKTCCEDTPRLRTEGLKILRRPHDPRDKRRYKPRVKTSERELPSTNEIDFGLRAYFDSTFAMGRPRCKTPYLFVTAHGKPLSISAADSIIKMVAKHCQIDDLSWHSFRHTWAEELAEHLLNQSGGKEEEEAVQILRELGGWKHGSETPYHYIQNAMRKAAYRVLEQRNLTLYGSKEAE